MGEKLKKVVVIAFLVHLVGGFLIIAALMLAPPLMIGVGRFDEFVAGLEAFDFKWWLVVLSTMIWAPPIGVAVLWSRLKAAGIEIEQLRDRVRGLLEDRFIPVKVDIEERLPVVFDQEMIVPVALKTHVDIDSDMEIEATIPIRTEMELDTTISTKVLGIGPIAVPISVPIRATVPLDFSVPIAGKLRIKAMGVPIDLDEKCRVALPPIEIPLDVRLETRIDLLSNLESGGIQKKEV
ncbi:MAG: hypothetical protein P1V51_13905 [Deltaproteobacteria bacterium]|nr:hypothetical protein [Deltaproteobacteria bacterium]